MFTRAAFVVLLCLLVFVFYQHYLGVSPDVSILQTTVSGWDPDVLREKSPVVVEDPVADLDSLLANLMGAEYLWRWDRPAPAHHDESAPLLVRNLSKHLVVHNAAAGPGEGAAASARVLLYHPDTLGPSSAAAEGGVVLHSDAYHVVKRPPAERPEPDVELVLHEGQTLVLPAFWTVGHVEGTRKPVEVFLHGPMTRIFAGFVKK